MAGPALAPQSLGDASSVTDWLQAIWIRRRLIFALFAAFLIVGLVIVSMFPSEYRARAVLEVLPERQPNTPANPIASAILDNLSVNTEAKKVGADPVLRSVFLEWQAGKLGPTGDTLGEFGLLVQELGSFARTIRRLLCPPHGFLTRVDIPACTGTTKGDRQEAEFAAFQNGLSVDVDRGTRLITVSYSASRPKVAANVANAVVSEYLRRHALETQEQSKSYVEWLRDRLKALEPEVEESDKAVARFRGETSLIEMAKKSNSARRSPTVEALAHALQELSVASTAMSSARSKLDAMRELRSRPDEVGSSPEIADSKLIQDLVLQQTAIESKLAALASSYGASSPVLAKVQAQKRSVRRQIELQIDKLFDAASRGYKSAAELVLRLRIQVSKLEHEAAREALERVKLRKLERRADANAQLYTVYLRQAREAIEAASWQPIAANVVAQARSPARPVFPDYRLLVPAGSLASACAAMLIGAVTELRRQRRVFNGPLDFKSSTGMRVVGVVPWVRRPMASNSPRNFRTAIENVAFRLLGPTDCSPSLAIAVTSAVPGEGKSVMAVSLARQLLEDGAKVVIVDADIRRPRVRQALRALPGCRARQVFWDPSNHLCDTGDRDTLQVLTLADTTHSAKALLSALPQVIATLKRNYDVVIVDTPPLLGLSDALAALPACDRILFAVRCGSTTRDAVEVALQELSDVDRARIQVVLTEVGSKGYLQYGEQPVRLSRGPSNFRNSESVESRS